MESGGKNIDPIVREFSLLARYGWSRADECTTLMRHPLVIHIAGGDDDARKLVMALKKSLKGAINHLKKSEKDRDLPYGRSVANASFRLLRLSREDENRTLTELREEVAKNWNNRKGQPVGESTFRLHFEEKGVLNPFAREFLAFARRELRAQGKSLGEDSQYLEPARTMAERMARRLEDLENEWHDRRIHALGNDGSFKIKDEDEMLDVLLALNDLAERGFLAVDYTPISKWSTNPQLKKYLLTQFKRISESKGKITLERIRIVTKTELEKDQDLLVKFAQEHQKARASLLLIPKEALDDLGVTFNPHNGLLLTDADVEPIALTGRLGEGTVGRALIYTRAGNDVSTLLSEYEILKAAIEENGHDAELRAQLGLKPSRT